MKNFFSVVAIAMSALAMSSCGGPADPVVPDDPDNEKPLATGYYIYADKDLIEADGKDIATFTVKDQDGNIISTDDNMGKVMYEDIATGVRLDRYSTGLISVVDGEFEYAGVVSGKKTLNTVMVKAQNRSKYEKFHKFVTLFKLTATWCPNCPGMTAAINGLGEDARDHMIVLACHNDDAYSVDMGNIDLAAAVALHAKPELTTLPLPSSVYDLALYDDARTVSMITRNIMSRRIESPAASGVKIASVKMEGSDLKISASVKADKGGEFDLTCALLADGIIDESGYADGGLYNDVVISVNRSNFLSMAADTKFSLASDEEKNRDFVFSFGEDIPSEDMLKSLKVVVLSLKKDTDGNVVVDNAAQCAYGSSTDYVYNK